MGDLHFVTNQPNGVTIGKKSLDFFLHRSFETDSFAQGIGENLPDENASNLGFVMGFFNSGNSSLEKYYEFKDSHQEPLIFESDTAPNIGLPNIHNIVA